ncbi:hypothetical protein P0082_01510 [Candidatus Haliotispira prima]|uniref:Lipoprotein n=1 Tax=Candidatus Haliotispira prima TaxID=3034016 RepID=A0ABY8MK44_9SPIO|nr:hypothetical protein P0082_01510 [Candidatus Haliotispira prima]
MKKTRLVLFCSILLSSLVLFSCQIVEEDNLLFQLKDNLRAAGTWQSGIGSNLFKFETGGLFTASIGGAEGNGSFRYSEDTFSSTRVGIFSLYWKKNQIDPTKVNSNQYFDVYKRSNGDLYFTFSSQIYIQTQ